MIVRTVRTRAAVSIYCTLQPRCAMCFSMPNGSESRHRTVRRQAGRGRSPDFADALLK